MSWSHFSECCLASVTGSAVRTLSGRLSKIFQCGEFHGWVHGILCKPVGDDECSWIMMMNLSSSSFLIQRRTIWALVLQSVTDAAYGESVNP